MPDMKTACITLLLLALAGGTLFTETLSDTKGRQAYFGQQPVLVDPSTDRAVLAKRVLSSTAYKVTPGDAYELIVRMEKTEQTTLILPEDHKLEVPFLGTMDVRGMSFSALRSRIITSIKSRLPVEFVDFVLSSPALFDVFVYGGVESPGITTVTPMNRVTEAIALTKGLKKGASYRRIQLMRDGAAINCDLARFVHEADLSQNPLLKPGDRIYVPHPDVLTQILGQVKYPDTYELLTGETLAELIAMAGGTLPNAEKARVEISRLDRNGKPQLIVLDLAQSADLALQHGDRVNIRSTVEDLQSILVEGALYGKPAADDQPRAIPDKPIAVTMPYVPNLTLLKALDIFGGPTPLADAAVSYINRPDKSRVYVDVAQLWKTRDPALDVTLEPGDHVYIPMQKLKVTVAGQINAEYSVILPYITDWRVADYIVAAGGIDLETGNPDAIFLVSDKGRRTPIGMDEEVEPGSAIYVDKNVWEHTDATLGKILVITGFVAAAISFTTLIIDLIERAVAAAE